MNSIFHKNATKCRKLANIAKEILTNLLSPVLRLMYFTDKIKLMPLLLTSYNEHAD